VPALAEPMDNFNYMVGVENQARHLDDIEQPPDELADLTSYYGP